MIRDLMLVQSSSGTSDPYAANVSLLLNGDGTNGSQAFVDSSLDPKTITAYGNAQISTAQKKYGTGSMYFDGNGDYLSLPSNLLAFGSADYTIECWCNITAHQGNAGILNTVGSGITSTNCVVLEFNGAANTLGFWVPAASAAAYVISGSVNVSDGAWHHIAVCRSGSSTKMFVDGVQDGSTYTGSYTITETTAATYIGSGAFNLSARTITGYIDDIRITKGIARYTANFTPPTQLLTL
jgi:hypothetical protein